MCRGDLLCAFSISRSRRPIYPPGKYQAFESRREVPYWTEWGRGGGARKREAPKCDINDKRRISARNTRISVSRGAPSGCVGFRQIPSRSVAAMSPIARSPRSYIPPPTNIRRFETADTLVIGRRGGGWGRRSETNCGNREEKMGIRSKCPPVGAPRVSVRLRWAPPGSAEAQCAHVTIVLSPRSLYSAPQTIHGVSKPPPRWAMCEGWGDRSIRDGAEERRRRRKMEDFRAYCPSVGVPQARQVPWGPARFRSGPLCQMAFLLAPTFHAPTNTRRFETADTLGIGEWGGTRGAKAQKPRKKWI